MGTAIKHPVPDRVKPVSFVILTSGHSDAQPWPSECPDVKNYKWQLNPSGTGCFIAVYPYGNSGRQRAMDRRRSIVEVAVDVCDRSIPCIAAWQECGGLILTGLLLPVLCMWYWCSDCWCCWRWCSPHQFIDPSSLMSPRQFVADQCFSLCRFHHSLRAVSSHRFASPSWSADFSPSLMEGRGGGGRGLCLLRSAHVVFVWRVPMWNECIDTLVETTSDRPYIKRLLSLGGLRRMIWDDGVIEVNLQTTCAEADGPPGLWRGDIFTVSPCYVSIRRSICNGETIKCDTGQLLDGAHSYNGAVCQVEIGGAPFLTCSQKTDFKNCIFLEIVKYDYRITFTDRSKNILCRRWKFNRNRFTRFRVIRYSVVSVQASQPHVRDCRQTDRQTDICRRCWKPATHYTWGWCLLISLCLRRVCITG